MSARPGAIYCPKRSDHVIVNGVVQSGRTKPQLRGKVLTTMRESKCLDCGHVWWSKIFSVINYAKFKNAEV